MYLRKMRPRTDVLVLGGVHAAPQRVGHLPELGLVACQSAAARFGTHAQKLSVPVVQSS